MGIKDLEKILKRFENIKDKAQRNKIMTKIVPFICPKGFSDSYWMVDDKKLKKYFDEEVKNMQEFKEVFGEYLSPHSTSFEFRFQFNMDKIFDFFNNIRHEDISDIPNCDFPEFLENFNKALKQSVIQSQLWSDNLDLEDIDFTKELIGNGAFGDLFIAKSKENKYALKLFHHPYKKQKDYTAIQWFDIVLAIKENLYDKRELFSKEPFAKLCMLPMNRQAQWYLMEFIEGKNMADLIEQKDFVAQKNIELCGKVLLAYANMLKDLHSNDFLFIDNKLSSIMVCDDKADKVVICDYDFVSSVEEANDPDNLVQRIYTPDTACYYELANPEIKKSKLGDLEGFALMIDSIFSKKNNSMVENYDLVNNVINAMLYKRNYPRAHRKRLPRQLRELIPDILKYPRRDESLTVNDFITAIKSDFKLQ